MTNYCKSNVRRVINYTNTEPLNKYDLWLSENLRYNEDGELEYDNNGLPACDLILKIFRNGKWEPIVGYNTTAGNKINVVNGVDYTYTAINHSTTHTNHGFSLNHLPLFRNPQDSPDELFDAGTLGLALNNFVTLSDWQTIIEDGGLGTAITEYSTENPFHLNYAGHQIVGGIWADRFAQSYDDTSAANKTYLAQAKYRYQQTASDYNLYVHAKDIIGAINTYQVENPNEPGINVGGDISIETLLGLFKNTATLEREVIFNISNHPIVKDNIWGAGSSASGNAGKILKLKDTLQDLTEYNAQNNFIEWVSPEELFNEYHYELPLASLRYRGGIRAGIHSNPGLSYTYLAECKLNPLQPEVGHEYSSEALFIDVRDVKLALDNWYADNDSTALDLNVFADRGVDVDKYVWYDERTGTSELRYWYKLNNYPLNNGLPVENKYPKTKNLGGNPTLYGSSCGLDWVGAQSIVEEGLGISGGEGYLYYDEGTFSLMSAPGGGGGDPYPVLGSNNYTEDGNYVIGVPSGGTGGATRYLNGLGLWSVPTINVPTFSGTSPGLVPQSTLLTRDKYLKGDGTWSTPSVNANFNINLATSFTSDGDFILNNLQLSSHSTENPISTLLEEWNYYNISGGNKTTQFTFSSTHNSGNAIYIRLYTGLHSVSINTDADIIFSNEVMSSSRMQFAANSSYLITIQFGIIKIEKITVNSNSSDSQN